MQKCHISSYIIDLVLSAEGRPFHPSVPSSVSFIQVPNPWMEEDDDDEWRPQQFYPNVISGACSRACWW
jgi:hypothetical protein